MLLSLLSRLLLSSGASSNHWIAFLRCNRLRLSLSINAVYARTRQLLQINNTLVLAQTSIAWWTHFHALNWWPTLQNWVIIAIRFGASFLRLFELSDNAAGGRYILRLVAKSLILCPLRYLLEASLLLTVRWLLTLETYHFCAFFLMGRYHQSLLLLGLDLMLRLWCHQILLLLFILLRLLRDISHSLIEFWLSLRKLLNFDCVYSPVNHHFNFSFFKIRGQWSLLMLLALNRAIVTCSLAGRWLTILLVNRVESVFWNNFVITLAVLSLGFNLREGILIDRWLNVRFKMWSILIVFRILLRFFFVLIQTTANLLELFFWNIIVTC